MKKITMREYLQEYTEKMHELMFDHAFSIKSMSFDCCFCPFKDMCNQDDTDRDCAKFIADHISDMQEYKER